MTVTKGTVTFWHQPSGRSFTYTGIETYQEFVRVLGRGISKAHGMFWHRKELIIEYEAGDKLYSLSGEDAWKMIKEKNTLDK